MEFQCNFLGIVEVVIFNLSNYSFRSVEVHIVVSFINFLDLLIWFSGEL